MKTKWLEEKATIAEAEAEEQAALTAGITQAAASADSGCSAIASQYSEDNCILRPSPSLGVAHGRGGSQTQEWLETQAAAGAGAGAVLPKRKPNQKIQISCSSGAELSCTTPAVAAKVGSTTVPFDLISPIFSGSAVKAACCASASLAVSSDGAVEQGTGDSLVPAAPTENSRSSHHGTAEFVKASSLVGTNLSSSAKGYVGFNRNFAAGNPLGSSFKSASSIASSSSSVAALATLRSGDVSSSTDVAPSFSSSSSESAACTPLPTESNAAKPAKPAKPSRPPRIFFCTRTHSQIQQIVDELRQCHRDYIGDLKMVILGARKHLCVNKRVKERVESGRLGKSLDEVCKKMVKDQACFYARPRHMLRVQEDLKRQGIWDIEDALQLGRHHSGCSYMASRGLLEHAEYILAPYNYVIDPGIRAAMQVRTSLHRLLSVEGGGGGCHADENIVT